jgi:tetratricopeptide (TPR) repeat protein
MNNRNDATVHCCAECGKDDGDVSLKACGACMRVRYCNAVCQKSHWLKHKIECKQRVAELYDKALFKDPPTKEDCPICFLPMPVKLISCMTLPPATITSVPMYDFAIANEILTPLDTEHYYFCCGKSICGGCVYSFRDESGNIGKCPFCKADTKCKTYEEMNERLLKRVEVNDAGAIYLLGNDYHKGRRGLLQDEERAIELWKQAAKLGSSHANYNLGHMYDGRGDLKKAKFYYGAAAIAGHETARCNLGFAEQKSGNFERAVKHVMIAASAGNHQAMDALQKWFEDGFVSRAVIDSTLAAYNNSCAEMRSEARDAYIKTIIHPNI